MMELPLFRQIHEDDRCSSRDLLVWRRSVERLDLFEWRKLSSAVYADIWGIPERTIRRALENIVAFGYLYRRECDARGQYEYRIPFSRIMFDGDFADAPPRDDDPPHNYFLHAAQVEHTDISVTQTTPTKQAKRVLPRIISRGVL